MFTTVQFVVYSSLAEIKSVLFRMNCAIHKNTTVSFYNVFSKMQIVAKNSLDFMEVIYE